MLTDNEIVKALDIHIEHQYCDGCPYEKNAFCEQVLIHDAGDLINRQKAEIERLRCDLEQTEDAFNKTYEMLAAYRAKFDDIVVGNESVVRCKDCKHYKNDTPYCKEHNKGYCLWDGVIKTKKHYCSYGERKEDGNAND